MSIDGNIGGVNSTQSTQGLHGIDSGTQNLSVADQTMLVMLERSEILEKQIRSQINKVHESNQRLQMLSDIQSKLRNMKQNTQTVDSTSWTVGNPGANDKWEGLMKKDSSDIGIDTANTGGGKKEITLDNGYSLILHGEKKAWTIRDANGSETKIWGDPHVSEGDAEGNKNWDFQQDATFILGDGTKIHVGTKDVGREDKNVVTDTLTITKGNQSLVVTNIAADDPQIGVPSLDGGRLDAETNDGHVFIMGDEADDWIYHQGGSDEHIGSDGWVNVTEDVGAIDYEHSMGVAEEGNINATLSPEELSLLDELDINIFDNSEFGEVSPAEIDNLITSITSKKDTMTSISQLEMVKLQSYNGKYEQTNAMSSQVMKSQYGQAKEIIRNI